METMHKEPDNWRVWNEEKEYGEVFYKRASGVLPEMESSKAVAKIIKERIEDGDQLLDIGCGAGHYLRSLLNEVKVHFSYQGVDATQQYIDLARKAWSGKEFDNLQSFDFKQGDIFNIPFDSSYAQVVMCNNVLLHLPSVEKPIKELLRVSQKFVVIRTLIGNASFKIKQVQQPEAFDHNGEPVNFHYYNIYSEEYIKSLLNKENNIKKVEIFEDRDFNVKNIEQSKDHYTESPKDITTIINGMQINNYIIQPWKFVVIEKEIP